MKAFAIELDSRYIQVTAMRIMPTTMLAIAGVEERVLTLFCAEAQNEVDVTLIA
jgi:hypothetical protein